MRGRVHRIDLEFWEKPELQAIANLGLEKLVLSVADSLLEKFAIESLGSPLLMQAICLHMCYHQGIEEPERRKTGKEHSISSDDFLEILRSTVAVTDCRTAYKILSSGPMRRGQPRNTYLTNDGNYRDVYELILIASASDPPRLSIEYEEIKDRINMLVRDDAPQGSSILRALKSMVKIVKQSLDRDRVIDWDADRRTIDFPDPHFLFFLRQDIPENLR